MKYRTLGSHDGGLTYGPRYVANGSVGTQIFMFRLRCGVTNCSADY